jgi:ribosomal protein L15
MAHKGQQGHKGHKGQQDHRGLMVTLGLKGQQVQSAPQVRMEKMEKTVLQFGQVKGNLRHTSVHLL